MRTIRRTLAVLAGSAAAAALIAATPALADPITYNVDEPIGSGGVTGAITTDGTLGTLSQADIIDWNLVVRGVGASITLSPTNSAVVFRGVNLTATPTELKFNFSGTDNGYLGFQATNPGVFSGFRYVCFSADATNFVCRHGESAVPEQYSSASAQYQERTGNQVIATGGAPGGSSGGTPSTGNPQLDQVIASLRALGDDRLAQQLLYQLQSYLLVGLNEQVSCGDCGGVGLGFGSFNVGAHGRRSLNDQWTVLGGVNYGQYRQGGADVDMNAGFALALQYDPWASMGRFRPYVTAGVSGAVQHTTYSRAFDIGLGPQVGEGRTRNYNVSVFGQLGWVARVTPRDEFGAFIIASRTWQMVRGYAEADQPASATMPGGDDVSDTLGVHAQFTHLITRRVEFGVNGGIDRVYQRSNGLTANVAGLSIAVGERPSFLTGEVGARLGLRLMPRMTLDMFVNGVIAPDGIGSSVHGGFGARWSF